MKSEKFLLHGVFGIFSTDLFVWMIKRLRIRNKKVLPILLIPIFSWDVSSKEKGIISEKSSWSRGKNSEKQSNRSEKVVESFREIFSFFNLDKSSFKKLTTSSIASSLGLLELKMRKDLKSKLKITMRYSI